MVVKNVGKTIELNQEFSAVDPFTKLKLNKIYTSHSYGSPLWNLFSTNAVQLETSYNRSVKVMLDLPFGTQRNLIEPITSAEHMKIILTRKFLSFIDRIKNSMMAPLIMLMTAQSYE